MFNRGQRAAILGGVLVGLVSAGGVLLPFSAGQARCGAPAVEVVRGPSGQVPRSVSGEAASRRLGSLIAHNRCVHEARPTVQRWATVAVLGAVGAGAGVILLRAPRSAAPAPTEPVLAGRTETPG